MCFFINRHVTFGGRYVPGHGGRVQCPEEGPLRVATICELRWLRNPAVDGEHPSIYRVSTIRLVVQDCADFNLIALGMELGSRMVPWSINRNWGDFSAKKGFNIRWINIHSHVGRAPKFAVLLWQPVYQRVLEKAIFGHPNILGLTWIEKLFASFSTKEETQ